MPQCHRFAYHIDDDRDLLCCPCYNRHTVVAKACGEDLRVHFKNTRETAQAISGKNFNEAVKFLEDVIEHKAIVPFKRFRHTVGRKAQCKVHGWTQGRWPEKSCRFVLQLLRNAESNAQQKNLKTEDLYVSNICVNQARKSRRRTYRAHGRINPFMAVRDMILMILIFRFHAILL